MAKSTELREKEKELQVSHCLCPVAAIYFARTGKAVRSRDVFKVADGEMDQKSASLDIAIAADEKLDSRLGRSMLSAVGIKASAA